MLIRKTFNIVTRRGLSTNQESLGLVDVKGGSQLWGEQYDRELPEILSIEKTIAEEIAGKLRTLLPMFDHGLHALVSDLRERGLWDDVAIVAWGEFGRTPVVNKNGGRDHWPRVAPALLAGGPLRGGHVLGVTDRTAASVTTRPIPYRDVFATLYHTLGINALRTTIIDPRGRPQYLLDGGEVLRDVV